MQTQCNESCIEFHGLGERILTTDFEGGNIVSDGGVPLIAEVDRKFDVLQRYAACFTDHRDQELIEHSVLDLVRQRIYGLCLGYEDLNDHDLLRADPLIAACVGKQDLEGEERRREADRGMPMAGKSTLNRLELSKVGADPDSPYCKIVADLDGMANLLVDLFLDAQSLLLPVSRMKRPTRKRSRLGRSWTFHTARLAVGVAHGAWWRKWSICREKREIR